MPSWKQNSDPLPPITQEQREQFAAKMAEAVAEMIRMFGGKDSTAHKVAAILAELGED